MKFELNTLWPQAIRRHIYELVLLNIVLALLAITYISWQKASTKDLMLVTNDYHQASARHYLKALEEIRHIEFHTTYEIVKEKSGTDPLEKTIEPSHDFNKSNSFHLIKKEIHEALKLQRIYKDSDFTALIERLENRLSKFLLSVEHASSMDHVSDIVMNNMLALVMPVMQLEKLHSIKHDQLQDQLTIQEENQATVFYIVISIVVIAVFLITWHGLRAINMIIKEQMQSVEQIRIFSQAIDQSPVSIMIANKNAELIYVNKTFEKTSGYSANEVIGKNPRMLQSGKTKPETYKKIWQSLTNGNSCEHELINKKKNNELLYERAYFSPILDDDGEACHYLAVKEDITLRKISENALRKSEANLLKAQEIAKLGCWELDLVTNELIWSDEIYRIFEINPDKFGASYEAFLDTVHPDDRDLVNNAYSESLRTKEPYTIEHRLLMKDGRVKYVTESCETTYDHEGNPLRSLGTVHDITLRKKQEERIAYQAHYDVLTKLPNRFLALDRLAQLLNETLRKQEKIAVLFLDLDDFKKVNDTLGHETGDLLLVEAANRLSNAIRSGDTVGRLGGDEFILLLPGLKDDADAIPVMENIIEQFRLPFKVNSRDLILTASIGIALFPGDGESPSELLRNADSAMYNAKEIGRNTYSYFTEDMNKKVSRRLALEEQMHGALDRNEFYLLYQPQVDINTKQIIGAEALLRWKNPALGEIFPDEFIPVAEQSGLILPIGQFVLEASLTAARKWQQTLHPHFRIAVNVSPRQFRDANFVSAVEHCINEAQIPAESLELEITEGVLMSGHKHVEEALQDLDKLGVEISMDDFGTGYSSLSYLRNYPFKTLKIDRSFVNDITTDPADRALVDATIAMAHSLGLNVIAEGVETEEQLSHLESQQCEFAQGYLFSKPIPPENLTALLTKQNSQGENESPFNVIDFNLHQSNRKPNDT